MDFVTIILSLALVLIPMLILFKRIQRKQRIARIIDRLPGPKAYPIVGTTFAFVGVPKEKLFTKFHERTMAFYPGPFRTWLGMSPSVHLLKAEHIEVVMSSQKHITKGAQYKFLEPWLGLGLLTSTGAKWHSHRKMITPAFHFRILDIFIDIFFEKSNILVNKLKPLADGRVFDIYPFITHCALDIICETAMGVEMNAQNNTTSDYVSAVYEVSDLSMKRSITPWLHPDFVWKRSEMGKRYNQCLEVLHGFTNKVIKERKTALETGVVQSISENKIDDDDCYGKKKRLAFLDLLLEASQGGTKLTDVEIREETDTFMFEGHDTTTAGICWSLFLLGNNLEIQEKIFAELDDIFQGSDRPTTKQDLNEMKYLERAIKEALRLYPSVPVIVRKLYEDIEIAGYEIPMETLVVLHIFESQRDPDHFPDPNVFDPDNFLPENIQKRHPYAFVPFSAGPRNCIGQKFALFEEKAVLSTILRKYKVKSLEKPEDLNLQASLILRPASGIKVSLEPRVY